MAVYDLLSSFAKRDAYIRVYSNRGLLYTRTDFLPKQVAKIGPKIDTIMLHYHSN